MSQLTGLDVYELVKIGRIRPNLPETAKYQVMIDFSFRLGEELINLKVKEQVFIRSEDALPLLISRHIEPIDSSVWAPSALIDTKPDRLKREDMKKMLRRLGKTRI